MTTPRSRDGYQWTPDSGLQPSLPTRGYITPQTNLPASPSTPTSSPYDVIVIGAGYAGLTASRDLTLSGHTVLLLEARDRIGGRTWSSDLDGYPYELGGTWVHWNQPFVWREIARYGFDREGGLESSHVYNQVGAGGDGGKWILRYGDDGNGKRKEKVFTREEEGRLMEKAFRVFVNVDGVFGRKVIPVPGDPWRNKEEFGKYEAMSMRERLNNVKPQLTEEECHALEGFLSITSGGLMEESSFGEMLRWWALNGFDMTLFMEMCLTWKFKEGQSAFARKFFDEASDTGRLRWSFGCPVAKVEDQLTATTATTMTTTTTTTADQTNLRSQVKVTTRQGQSFHAKRVVCTIPLNVLNDMEFLPPLSPLKVKASTLGHVNQVSKVHVECTNPELRSLSATTANPHHNLTYIFGDGTTPAGNSHLVSFGSSYPGCKLEPEEDIDRTIAALKHFAEDDDKDKDKEMDVKRVVFHNWSKDEFSKGAWEWLRPGMMKGKYMDALRQRQGNVLFASADWARLWRGFIDGAIEDGTRVAKEVMDELRVFEGVKM